MAHKGEPRLRQGKEEINLSSIATNVYDSLSFKHEHDHTYDDINAVRSANSSDTKLSGRKECQASNTGDTTLRSEVTVTWGRIVLAVTGSLLLSTLISVTVGITVYHVTIAKMADSDKQDLDRANTAASPNTVDTLILEFKQLQENVTTASDVWHDEMTSLKSNVTAASDVWHDEMTSLKSNVTAATDVWHDEMTSLKSNVTAATDVWHDEMTSLKSNVTAASDVWHDEMTSLKSNVTAATDVWHDEMTSLKSNVTAAYDVLNYEMTSLKSNFSELKTNVTSANDIILSQHGKDCSELYAAGIVVDGIYTISPDGRCPFPVYCDMTGGGWTLIQNRIDGLVSFNRTWQKYVEGFGNIDGEHWLGLDKIHRLTADGSEIYFQFEYYDGTTGFAHYQTFTVHGVITDYRMNVDAFGYNGTIEELLGYHNNMKFSTYDRDNDATSVDCAARYGGSGWWYYQCYRLGNLNGFYGIQTDRGIAYYDDVKLFYLKTVNIKVKPVYC